MKDIHTLLLKYQQKEGVRGTILDSADKVSNRKGKCKHVSLNWYVDWCLDLYDIPILVTLSIMFFRDIIVNIITNGKLNWSLMSSTIITVDVLITYVNLLVTILFIRFQNTFYVDCLDETSQNQCFRSVNRTHDLSVSLIPW